jgi:glycosyltransferase involved in cell wall biosynthesis
MHAYVDLQSLQGPFYERGIARYVAALIRELIHDPARADAVGGLGTNANQGSIPDMYADLRTHPLTAPTTRSRWRSLTAEGEIAYVCPSAFEGMKPIADLWPSAVIESNAPLVAIVHDTIPLRFPEVFQKTREQRAFYTARSRLLRHADLFLTNSQCSADDLAIDVGVEPSRIRVIGTGIDQRFTPAADLAAARATVARSFPLLTKPYILNVTGWPDTKNALGFLEAIAALPAEIQRAYQFVLASRVPPETETLWRDTIRSLRLPDDAVVITGFIPDDVLVPLYQCTELLVCPSLYEGFGLPVAEAAACGRPTICSNVSSLPEILDFPAATFDPRDPQDMANRITSALTDEPFRLQLLSASAQAARAHTWNAVATKFISAVSNVSFPAPQRPVQERIAVQLADHQRGDDPEVRIFCASLAGASEAFDLFGHGSLDEPAPNVRLLPIGALRRTQSVADYTEVRVL